MTGAGAPGVGGPAGPSRASRGRGCALAAAVGDALGHATEFLDVAAIRQRFGPDGLTGYGVYWEAEGRRFAPYTDDTQLAEVVALSLLAARQRGWTLDAAMEDLARRIVAWADAPQGGHRAPGNACLAGARALRAGVPWRKGGAEDAGGCGSVMRAWPCGLAFADDAAAAERWAVAQSLPTHRHPMALAASAGLACAVAAAVRGEGMDVVARAAVEAAFRYDERTGAMVGRAVQDARGGTPSGPVLDRLRGWAAHEALAAAVFVAVRHEGDLRAALLTGANAPGDSDSIASIAGALLGAHLGDGALPAAWVAELERSDEIAALGAALAGA